MVAPSTHLKRVLILRQTIAGNGFDSTVSIPTQASQLRLRGSGDGETMQQLNRGSDYVRTIRIGSGRQSCSGTRLQWQSREYRCLYLGSEPPADAVPRRRSFAGYAAAGKE